MRTSPLLSALILLGGGGLSAAAPSTPNTTPIASPTKVLAELAGKNGNVYFPAQPGGPITPGGDRTLAPYFHIPGSAPGTDQLPLKETSADVSIAGVIARVRVHQVYENQGSRALEAVYVFPASTRAAVHGMRMKVGGRIIEAKINRRQVARAAYETARQQGRRASLLEQERPNVFTMNVANVMPRDRIEVELDYSELLVPEDAVYELVYPTVVGPRYTGGANPHKDGWMANPHLPAGHPQPYRFDVKVHLQTGIAIKELSSPSHQVAIDYAGPNSANVRLAAAGGGNRDFVLRYRLAGDRIETGLLLWDGAGAGGEKESFFALLMEPPQRPAAALIPPREYIFLLDVSGSMHGYPLNTAKTLMRNLLGRLRPTDQFNVSLFSGASYVLSADGSLPATAENIRMATAVIDQQQGGGGTELMGGLQACYRIPRRDRHVSRTVVVVTDGYVGVEAQAFRFIRERLDDANLFAFGIGGSVNRGLIEGMARAGQGEPFVVLNPETAPAAAERLRMLIETPVLTRVAVSFKGFDAYDVAPGKLPDLLARRPLLLFGKYRGGATGLIEVTGENGQGRLVQTLAVRPADVSNDNAPLRWLWARRWVEILEDERHMGGGQPVEDAITNLGLGYSLLTAFTSFVAVDSRVVNPGGQNDNVRQPLPMPQGVSNLAVGAPVAKGSSAALRMMAPMKTELADAESDESGFGRMGGAGSGASPSRRSGMAAPREARATDESAPAGGGKDDAAKSVGRPAPPPAATTITRGLFIGKAVAVGNTNALVIAIQQALAKTRGGCATTRAIALMLRLTIDLAGHVTKVDVLSGDPAQAACVRAALTGLVSATTAQGAAAGTVEVTLPQR